MRRTFLTWLLILVCAAFAVTGFVAYWQFRNNAEQQAEQLMATRLRDLLELVDYTASSMERLRLNNDEMALARTRAIAEIVRLNPASLTDMEVLQGLCNDLGAEQIAITDEQGIIRAAVPAGHRGFDLKADKDAANFIPCIHTPGYEHVQRAEAQIKNTGLQYVGVHRQDVDGIIRAGFRPQYEQRAKEAIAYGRLAANHRLGKTGRTIAFREGAPLNREALPGPAADFLSMPVEQLIRMNINGDEHFVYALQKKGVRLVGFLPLRDFYPMGMQSLRTRLTASSLILLSVFALVSFLLQRFVISRLANVNETLRRIGEGELDARVTEASSPEFVRLSTGINAMLDSLKVMSDQGQESLRKELELARSMQRNALPGNLPQPQGVAIEATLIPAASVGGDFYDVFQADADHLTFMLAAVSGTGVPAALYMMRSLSIIRNFARSGRGPSSVLSEANRILCEGRTADLSLSLFYGDLELSSGILTYVNAGLESPLLQHLRGGNYAEPALGRSPVLGAMEGVTYRHQQLQLEPGDRLFLCTRGLVLAQNSHKEHFGLQRLIQALSGEMPSISELPNTVRRALRSFTENTAQEQDITMLTIEYQTFMRKGGQVSTTASIPEPALSLLQHSLETVLAAPVDIAKLQQATAAILSALPPDTPVTLTLGCDETRAELNFTYPGDNSNPLPLLELSGIDTASFNNRPDGNHITLSKTLG